MADWNGPERGRPGGMKSGGISPVIGDIERMTIPPPEAGGIAGTAILALRELGYPLARDDLVREAAMHRAPGELLALIARLPNRVYRSAEDVAGELQRTPAGGPGLLR